jgi:hypothetical protein
MDEQNRRRTFKGVVRDGDNRAGVAEKVIRAMLTQATGQQV